MRCSGCFPSRARAVGGRGGGGVVWVGLHGCGQDGGVWDGVGPALWSEGRAAPPEKEGANLRGLGNLPRVTLWCPAVATMVWEPKACFCRPNGGGAGSCAVGVGERPKAPGHSAAALVLPVDGGEGGCGGPAAHVFVLPRSCGGA